MSELKSTLDRINSTLDIAEEIISELEYVARQLCQVKQKKDWKEMNRAAVNYETTSGGKIHL